MEKQGDRWHKDKKMDERLEIILKQFKDSNGNLTVLTGAGISAESGIPTFRGKEGYWTVGSKEYRPEEMATLQMFTKNPFEVWQWYLYRKTVCADAHPNPGHMAIVELENIFKDRFCLITQNVDGLHLRAGNTIEKTYQIHGNINFMRCAKECSMDVFPIPSKVSPKEKREVLTKRDKNLLVCPHCVSLGRPHVLWFDEYYNENYFRFESSLQKAMDTDLLLVVGTSGATNLPMQIGTLITRKGALMIDINPMPNPFSHMAENVKNGCYCQAASGKIIPEIVNFLRD